MIYSNYDFLVLMPVLLVWFYTARTVRAQNTVLLLVSIGFIAWAGIWNLIIFLAVVAVVYLYARLDARLDLGRAGLTVMIAVLALNLIYFKYRDFIGQSLGVTIPAVAMIAWLVPLGISFYTFEAVSATLDLKRRQQTLTLRDWSLFMSFFPHLIAGPVVRYRQLAPQFSTMKLFNWRNVSVGLHFFTVGFIKKLAADPIGRLIDPVWSAPSQASVLALMLALLGFYVQLYLDFSGYTDMGRGIARMLGYRLPLNFRAPYFAASPGEFFERWHVSLSSWMRDYLYVPLGGNRRGRLLTIRNLVLTMLIGGIWHGASWKFVVWGLWLGSLMVCWSIVMRGRASRTLRGHVLGIVLMQLGWIVSLVFFRAESFQGVADFFRGLVSAQGTAFAAGLWWCLVAVVVVMVSQGIDYCVWKRPVARTLVAARATRGGAVVVALVFLFALGVKIAADNATFAAIGSGQSGLPSVGFIYFQF